jgi:hypothetical protein
MTRGDTLLSSMTSTTHSSSSLHPNRLLLRHGAARLATGSVKEASLSTRTTTSAATATNQARVRFFGNRQRANSGGLPKRKLSDDDFEVSESEYERVEDYHAWHDDDVTPPRLEARVYAASAPRLRQQSTSRETSPTRLRGYADEWLIPHQHPLKVLWDCVTVLLSLVNAYATHMAIRDRQFQSPFIRFCEVWFVLDILLNFVSQRTTNDGRTVLATYRAVWARYLTSWFVVDVLSLFPAELLYLQPVVDAQRRRTFWQRSFFRTKAVVKVTRWLRLHHVNLIRRMSQHTKRAAGIGASRFVRLLIRYAPKYILWFRKTRGVLAVRMLRQFRVIRCVCRDLAAPKKPFDNATANLTEEGDVPEDQMEEDWEVLRVHDDEDDDPF